MIREDAIHLLRHRPIMAAEPGFDVADGDAELACGHGAGERRVDVTRHDDQVWRQPAERDSELRSRGFRRPCLELHMRTGERQLGEEDVVQQGVVVLARVDEKRSPRRCRAQPAPRRPVRPSCSSAARRRRGRPSTLDEQFRQSHVSRRLLDVALVPAWLLAQAPKSRHGDVRLPTSGRALMVVHVVGARPNYMKVARAPPALELSAATSTSVSSTPARATTPC